MRIIPSMNVESNSRKFTPFNFLFILLFVVVGQVGLNAQTAPVEPTAWVNDNATIMLNFKEAPATSYIADVSHYASNMPDQTAADDFITLFDKPLINLSVDVAEYILTIDLVINNETSSWTILEWNEYLETN